MTLFWFGVFTLLVVTLLVMLKPFIVKTVVQESNRNDELRYIHQQKLKSLDDALTNQEITLAEYDAARAELERATLSQMVDDEQSSVISTLKPERRDQYVGLVLFVLVSTGAVASYLWLGVPQASDPAFLAQMATPERKAPALTADDINTMIERIKTHLQDNEGDVQGWAMLGQALMTVKRYDEARVAYDRLVSLQPRNPDYLISYAESIAHTQDNNLLGQPIRYVNQALKIDPTHKKAQWLYAIAAFQEGDRQAAISAWQALSESADTTEEERLLLASFIANAQGEAGFETGVDTGQKDQKVSTLESEDENVKKSAKIIPRVITVNVVLSPDAELVMRDTSALFVFVKAQVGPPIPLAVQRIANPTFPLTIDLTTREAMMENMTIDQFDRVYVQARLSQTGIVDAQPDDIETKFVKINLARHNHPTVTLQLQPTDSTVATVESL